MKKYFVSLLAVAVAIIGFSFTTSPLKKSDFTTYYIFSFPATATPSISNVENESLWVFGGTTTTPASCDDPAQQKACRLYVLESFVNDPEGSPELKSSTVIDADEFESNVAFVAHTADDVNNVIRNKENL